MNTKFKGGRHAYYGKTNGSGKRKMSKIYKGIKLDFKSISVAFKNIEKEYVEK